MPNAEMKTLTIGDTTYEIVDEEAREREGDLSDLDTQVKTDLVAAINEVANSSGVVSVNGKTGAVELTAADVGAATTGALTDETTARTAADAQLQGQITALGNGAPIPVETIAAMTVQTNVYLYTGSETGESTGYWYTYDSTQAKFVPRGEYGAGVIIDNTLTIPNAAADAKAVGDALADKADADDLTALGTRVTAVEGDIGEANERLGKVIELVGKNMFDQSKLTLADGWTGTDGVYTGTVGNLAAKFSSANGGLPVYGTWKENTRYTLSAKVRNTGADTATGWGLAFWILYTDGTTRNTSISKSTVDFATRTLISEANKTIQCIYVTAPSSPTNTWEIKEMQIEEGTTATEYEAFSLSATDEIARNEVRTLGDNVDSVTWLDVPLVGLVTGKYIKYSDGGTQGTNSSQFYLIKNPGYKSVRFWGYGTSNSVAAVAFYSDSFSTEDYLKNASINYTTLGEPSWINANVPEGAKYIAFCHGLTDGYTPHALYSIDSLPNLIDSVKAVQVSRMAYYAPFADKRVVDHLFVSQVTSALTDRIIIPCQSVFHVGISARLGFKYIEGNVQATATAGKYIITHGNSGKFGKDIVYNNGDSAEGLSISQLEYDYIRQNFRYVSQYTQYQVSPTSLEEFLYACRLNNMWPLLQYRDDTMLSIAKRIVGNNMILYNGNHNVFDGFCCTYHSYTTKEQIVAQCESIGAPYIYGMANPQAFTDEELKDIAETLHGMGFYLNVSSAYTNMTDVQRCYKFGFDFDTAEKMVNPFEVGNMATLSSGLDFSEFTHGGVAADGKLTLATEQNLHTESYDAPLLKYTIKIMFSGTLKIDNNVLTSDGTEMIVITGYRLFGSHSLWVIAQDDSEITMLKYTVSKC